MAYSIAAAVVFLAKFFIYAIYADKLNAKFDKAHNKYKMSGVRMLLSLAFTGLQALILGLLMDASGASDTAASLLYSPLPFLLSMALAALAWYILLRVFYVKEASPEMYRAMFIGTLISAVIGAIVTLLSFIGLISNVNFC